MPACAPSPAATYSAAGRGESEGAGTGDDQDRQCRGDGLCGRVAEQEPRAQGQQGDQEDGGHEDVAHPVGQPLHGRLLVLGVLDQPEHLRQLRLAADLGGAHDQTPADRDRAADHEVAHGDIERL